MTTTELSAAKLDEIERDAMSMAFRSPDEFKTVITLEDFTRIVAMARRSLAAYQAPDDKALLNAIMTEFDDIDSGLRWVISDAGAANDKKMREKNEYAINIVAELRDRVRRAVEQFGGARQNDFAESVR